MSQERMDYTKQLMSNHEDSLFVSFPFCSFFQVDLLEDRIDSDDRDGHQEQNAPQAWVSPFGDMTSAFPLSGFVDGGIEAGIGDQLLRCGEGTAMGLGQEMRNSGRIEAGDRVEDLQGNGNLIAAALDKKFRHFLQFLLEERQDTDFRAQDRFKILRGEADGGASFFDQELRREAGLAAPAVSQGQEKCFWRGLKDGILRGEGCQQAQRGDGEGIEDAENLGEKDRQIAFDLILEGDDLTRDVLAFPGQGAKFIGGRLGLGQALRVGSDELGNGGGVTLVGFGLSQGELDEVRDEQWVEQADIKAVSLKEGEQVQVIGAGRLHAESKRAGRRASGAQGAEEVAEAIGGHGKKSRPKELPLVIDQGGMKAILGDVDAAETDAHGFTSSGIIRFEAGDASRPILHIDEGSRTQSTYQDSGGQRTDSFEGSRAQKKWSSPASSLLSYSIDKTINNINYW